MIKNKMIEKVSNFLPMIGGSSGAVIGWLNVPHELVINACVTAIIFAFIGGIVGFLVNLSMKWITKKVCDNFKNKK